MQWHFFIQHDKLNPNAFHSLQQIFILMTILRLFILICNCSVLSVTVFSQDTIRNIPKGVVYKKVSQEENESAKKLIIAELSFQKESYSLFDSILIIGPGLWNRYSSNQVIEKIKDGNISLKINSYDLSQNKTVTKFIPAKLIQRGEDYKTVLHQIIKDISGKDLSFRKLNETELSYYWSVIFFDIEEPIYIIESNGRKFLFDLDRNSKLKWIDELF